MAGPSWGGRYSEGGYGGREREFRSDDDYGGQRRRYAGRGAYDDYGPEGYGFENYGRAEHERGDAPEGYQGYGRQGYGREGGRGEHRRREVGRSGYGGYEGGRYAPGGYGGGDYGGSYGGHGYGGGRYGGSEYGGRYGDPDRDYGRYGDDDGPQGYARYGRDDERGVWDRTRDEVASWFGDEEAEQRRRMDEMRAGRHRGRGPRGYSRSDERIREDVNDRLTDDPFVDASDVEVRVAEGEVTLEGSVEHRSDKRRAEDIAEQVSGVGHVQNNLRVRPSGGMSDPGGQAGSRIGSKDAGGSMATGSPGSSTGR